MILDIKTVIDGQTARFLRSPSHKEIDIGGECKSVVLSGDKGGYYLYRSPISAATLGKRMQNAKFIIQG